jgi:O-antigen/teichoic acid export membrane protein
VEAANMLGFLFASFLLSYIARCWSEGKNISSVVLHVRHFLMTTAITLSFVVIFLAPWLYKTLYHHDDPHSIQVLQWCIPSSTGYMLIQVYGTVMTATGHILAFSYVTLASILINLSLNLILIPSMGAMGSCIAALISQGFSGIVTMWYVKQKLNINIDLRSILIYIFIGALVCGWLYISGDLAISKWLIITASGTLALFILRLAKLIDLRSWTNFAGKQL